jgi:predicted nucleotide-binding protein
LCGFVKKFEDSARKSSYAIVLLSPDDRSKGKNEKKLQPQARQNVIFELGYLTAKLGRERVFVLINKQEGFKMPSDFAGVAYTQYDIEGSWCYKLCSELKSCGFNVSKDALK